MDRAPHLKPAFMLCLNWCRLTPVSLGNHLAITATKSNYDDNNNNNIIIIQSNYNNNNNNNNNNHLLHRHFTSLHRHGGVSG